MRRAPKPSKCKLFLLAIVDGVLSIPTLSMGPLVRIEAWRLRARGLVAHGNAVGACAALEKALEEASAVGYLWMEQVIRKELLEDQAEALLVA